MKHIPWCLLLFLCSRPSFAAPLAPPISSPAPLRAPRAALPALEALPGPNGTITLRLPPGVPLSNTRLRIGLFEAGRPARVADAVRDFVVRDGRLQATFALQADPGRYELLILANDRARTPMSAPALLVVNGIERRPGWWLLGGSPFVQTAPPEAANQMPPGAPLFVPGLKRDFNRKAKTAGRNVVLPANVPLTWKVMNLPPLSEMLAPDYSPDTLRSRLATQIQEAQNRGERLYLGFALPSDGAATATPSSVANVIGKVRQIINGLAPDAALILDVANAATKPTRAVREIGASAALCDAVVVRVSGGPASIWPLKAARRVAEEQPGYDLPVFVLPVAAQENRAGAAQASRLTLDAWMSGATGVISDGSTMDAPPSWLPVVQRNASLFVGSVTLEDTGVLPAPTTDTGDAIDASARLYALLRAARRVPLAARSTLFNRKSDDAPESFMVALGQRISDAVVADMVAAVKKGARLYVEGAPLLDENGQAAWKLAPLVGATAAAPAQQASLPGAAGRPALRFVQAASAPGAASLVLEDPWIFGVARGTRLDVSQTVNVKLNPPRLASQTKTEKGKDVLTGPLVVARLNDGSPGVIINPVGKGEVMWVPNPPQSSALRLVQTQAERAGQNPVADSKLQQFYTAVAGYVQPGLVEVRGLNRQKPDAQNVRVAMRRSPGGALLLALFNEGKTSADVSASITGVAAAALDLATEETLRLATRGGQSTAEVSIAAQGWKIIAFGATRRSLDEERNAPRLQAKIR